MKRISTLALLLTLSAFVLGPALAPPAAVSQSVLLTASRRVVELDAEFHLGLVADDDTQSVAEANTTKLNAALAACHAGGSFDFPGTDGPVLYSIRFSGKHFFFYGAIRTPARNGCAALLGAGANGVLIPSNATSLRGNTTRFIQLAGGEADCPGVIVLSGTGTDISHIEILGRDFQSGDAGTGTKTTAGIVVEGRTSPPAGHHTFHNVTFAECTYGIQAPAGYYEEDWDFVAEEQHGDHVTVDGCSFYTVNSAIRMDNLQAVNWIVNDCQFNVLGSGQEMVVFDLTRGGSISGRNFTLNHNKITLVKVAYYSHNTQRITIDGFRWDTFTDSADYLTLFQYAGPSGDASFKFWTVRLSGAIANTATAPTYDYAKMFQGLTIGDDLPTSDILVDVARLPTEGALAPTGYDYEAHGHYLRLVAEP